MATLKLTPSSYFTGSTYVTVTDPGNMYYDTDHTAAYATVRGRQGRSTNNTYYFYVAGFDFSLLPDDATINSINIKIRCRRNNYVNVGSAYRIGLTGGTGVIESTRTSQDINTYDSVLTIPIGDLTFDDILYFGSDLKISIPIRNTSSNSSRYPYVYIYGAEINIDYTPAPEPPVPVTDEDEDYYYIMFMQEK